MKDSEEPRRRQAALAMSYEGSAPKLIAKGYGALAEQIVSEAKRHGIPVHDSPELVGMLMQVDLDERIPPELYAVVAELLVWVSRLEDGRSADPE